MKRAHGFSLVELVVTLLIAAILAAFVVPRLSDPDAQAAWYHEEAKAAVRYAQRQAVAQKALVYVHVQADRIRLCYDVNCASPLLKLADGAPYEVVAPGGVALSPLTTFSFNGLGQPSPATTISVGGRTITVTPETGYVR